MRLWTLRVLGWLVLGAAATVTVAWLLASQISRPALCASPSSVDILVPAWPVPSLVPPGNGAPVVEFRTESWGVTQDTAFRFHGWAAQASANSLSLASDSLDEMIVISIGWPARSLRQVGWWESTQTLDQISWHECIDEPRNTAGSPGQAPLPTHPLALGFALDTIFFASVIAALSLIPNWLRQSRRAARGHCRRCNYNLIGLHAGVVCPECGCPISRPTRTRQYTPTDNRCSPRTSP